MTKDRLTYSRLSTRRLCPKQDYYKYELGLRREAVASALRMGGAFAKGKEIWRKGRDREDAFAETELVAKAIDEATADYQAVPQWADSYDWEIECETVRAMLAGYFWRYAADDLKFVGVETAFEMPLVNPATGRASQTFALAGVLDGIAVLPDERNAVYEDKTTSANIDDGSDYWLRLRYDGQISQYVLGARYLGWDVSLVLYDVTRKPTIKPRQVPVLDKDGKKIVCDAAGERVLLASKQIDTPVLDNDGLKIVRNEFGERVYSPDKQISTPVLDENGLRIVRDIFTHERSLTAAGKPRQTARATENEEMDVAVEYVKGKPRQTSRAAEGEALEVTVEYVQGAPRQTSDTKLEYTLTTRRESPEEWGERLLADMAERPEWYFARREIPRLEGDLDEFRAEVWQQAHLLRECRNNNWWFRNVAFNTCGHCEYKDLCLGGITVDPAHPPAGFMVMADVHPELLPDE